MPTAIYVLKYTVFLLLPHFLLRLPSGASSKTLWLKQSLNYGNNLVSQSQTTWWSVCITYIYYRCLPWRCGIDISAWLYFLTPHNYHGGQKVGDSKPVYLNYYSHAIVKYACLTCIQYSKQLEKLWLVIRRGNLCRNADFQRNEMGQKAELIQCVFFSFSKTPPIYWKWHYLQIHNRPYIKVLRSISKQLTRKSEQVGVGSSKCTLSSRTESTSSACNDNVT